jgi:ribosome biogenesis protein SSF1/2
MARKPKNKAPLANQVPVHAVTPTGKRMDRSPKTMVIRIGAGSVGKSVSQLVKDVRQVLQPDTAVRLQERKSNRLRDFTTMAGPLGVTHLLLFSRSTADNTNMRLALTPRGPTLSFRVENYSLCKDVLKAQKHPKSSQSLYLNSPLVSYIIGAQHH